MEIPPYLKLKIPKQIFKYMEWFNLNLLNDAEVLCFQMDRKIIIIISVPTTFFLCVLGIITLDSLSIESHPFKKKEVWGIFYLLLFFFFKHIHVWIWIPVNSLSCLVSDLKPLCGVGMSFVLLNGQNLVLPLIFSQMCFKRVNDNFGTLSVASV